MLALSRTVCSSQRRRVSTSANDSSSAPFSSPDPRPSPVARLQGEPGEEQTRTQQSGIRRRGPDSLMLISRHCSSAHQETNRGHYLPVRKKKALPEDGGGRDAGFDRIEPRQEKPPAGVVFNRPHVGGGFISITRWNRAIVFSLITPSKSEKRDQKHVDS